MEANCFLLSYSLHLCRTYGVLPTLNSRWRWGGGNALTFCKAVIETQLWSLMKNNGDQKGNLVLSIFACLYFRDLLNFSLYIIFVYHFVLFLLRLLLFRALRYKEVSARLPYSPRINYLYGICLKETIGILQKSLSDYYHSYGLQSYYANIL